MAETGTAAAVAPEELRRAVDAAVRIPDRHRVFAEPFARAVKFYRIPAPVLEALLDAGLPHLRHDGQFLLDRKDLENLLLALRFPSPQRAALGHMARALSAAPDGRPGPPRTLDIRARCPEPGHPGPCDFRLLDAVRESPHTTGTATQAPGHHRAEVSLGAGGTAHLPPGGPVDRIVAEAEKLTFHHLPAALAEDLGFLRDTGLADCRSASRHLVAVGAEAGLTVRPASGIFVSVPFSNLHSWIEVETADGTWLPADPFFLTALARWDVLDAGTWPPHRSPLGVYWPLGPYERPLLTHGGAGAAASLVTR